MGLFSRDTKEPVYLNPADGFRVEEPTLDEQSENMKGIAIEYIVSLDKKELESFIEGVQLIWQGYNNNVDKIKTRHQKALARAQAKASGTADADLSDDELDDELASAFLDDDAGKTNPLVTPPANTLPPKRPLGGGSATDVTKVAVKG